MGPEIGTCIGIDASVVWMSSSTRRQGRRARSSPKLAISRAKLDTRLREQQWK
jgi:hypothetical protein